MQAYNNVLFYSAQISLASMLDHVVYDTHMNLDDYWKMFLNSEICERFENGDPFIILGKSGIELAWDVVTNGEPREYNPRFYRTPEYWIGYSLSYYQWKKNIAFRQINEFISMDELLAMYPKYHEMDIEQFVDQLEIMRLSKLTITNLKRIREQSGYSQTELSKMTTIPVRTIQQYEQRQKNINHARADYVIALSKALYCKPEQLLEIE